MGNDENDDEEEDEMKDKKSKLNRIKGKIDNDNKKQRNESKVREGIEDDCINYEDKLKKARKWKVNLRKITNLHVKTM